LSIELIVQIGLVIVFLAAAVILSSSIRMRRNRQKLATLAHLHGLRRADEKQKFAAIPLANVYAGRQREIKLSDMVIGQDNGGRFFVARRRFDLHRDQVLFFETQDETRVADFHFFPYRETAWSWRRLLPEARQSRDDWKHRLEWSSSRSRWSDTGSLGFGARVAGHAARMSDDFEAALLGVEIHDRKILIHSAGVLGGEQLERFFGDSILLRRAILNAMRHAHSRAAESKAVPRVDAEPEDVMVRVIRS
jgi:hypothetical protein